MNGATGWSRLAPATCRSAAGRAKCLTSENRPGDPPEAVLFSDGGLNHQRRIDFLRQFCLNRRNRGLIRDHASRRGAVTGDRGS
jgi:hypothetical protein